MIADPKASFFFLRSKEKEDDNKEDQGGEDDVENSIVGTHGTPSFEYYRGNVSAYRFIFCRMGKNILDGVLRLW